MARLALFSVGFLVYTAVAAISVAQHPARYVTDTKSHTNVAGVCTTDGEANRVTHVNQTSSTL